jgi:hypothetical protein
MPKKKPPFALNDKYRPVTWDALNENQKRFADAYHEAQLRVFTDGGMVDTHAIAHLAAEATLPEGSTNRERATLAWNMLRNPKVVNYLNEMSSIEFMAAKSMAAQVLIDVAKNGNGPSRVKAAMEILDRDALFRKVRDLQVTHLHQTLPTGRALDDELRELIGKTIDAEFVTVEDKNEPLKVSYVDPATNRPVAALGQEVNDNAYGDGDHPVKHPPLVGRKRGRPPKKRLIPGKLQDRERVLKALGEDEPVEW